MKSPKIWTHFRGTRSQFVVIFVLFNIFINANAVYKLMSKLYYYTSEIDIQGVLICYKNLLLESLFLWKFHIIILFVTALYIFNAYVKCFHRRFNMLKTAYCLAGLWIQRKGQKFRNQRPSDLVVLKSFCLRLHFWIPNFHGDSELSRL